MKQPEFTRHNSPSRKDLLHFIEEKTGVDVLGKIGSNPVAWIDELQIVSQILTGEGLIGMVGFHQPPIRDPKFEGLGRDIYLYRGPNLESRGLWVLRKREEGKPIVGGMEGWTHYKIGTNAVLRRYADYSDVPLEMLLPENFDQEKNRVQTPKGEPDMRGKRPVFRFAVPHAGQEMIIYAKGAYVSCSYFYSHAKPGYRLTSLAGVHKLTSKAELEKTHMLASEGVHVPGVIGYYESLAEEFLFLEEIKGKTPDRTSLSERRTVLEQDASMLAALCLLGLRKQGFADFDDKVFDGTNLYLIDVEECCDLYSPGEPDYREMLVNPRDNRKLLKFRRNQRSTFKGMLKDALYAYRESIAPTRDDQRLYINTFFRRIGWSAPSEGEIERLTHFPKDYMPFDNWVSAMSDGD